MVVWGRAIPRLRCEGIQGKELHSGFMFGLGFRIQGSGFMIQGSGCRVQGLGFRVLGLCFKVYSLGFREM